MNMTEESNKEEFLNHENYAAETSVEHSLSPDYSSTDDIYGEPSVVPRLGDQYQAEIPAIVSESECPQLHNTSVDNVDGIDFHFSIGRELAIPIIRVHHLADHVGHAKEEILDMSNGSDAIMQISQNSKGSPISGFSLDTTNSYLTVPRDAKCTVEISDGLRNEIIMPLSQPKKIISYAPLPGSPKAFWSESESQSFLLGLYIFGKNLVQVQRFVERKDMGDVLSFYYGKFYRSDARRRWVECRKIRGRRCILGHRIFTGWRQQELLSRLLPGRSKEVEDSLLEVTKAFNDGTATLEYFIFKIKSMVGADALVEAIGIGKGKQDLTGITPDPVRTTRAFPARPAIPVGKACSSLTSSEIIKFLTGDFRLSKAKSNDLFWEAVWPRLLARGWHSEQPKDHARYRNPLVFLIPGIKKFSRKKLKNGNHYFDSVSDVLNKVASDPMMIELEVEEGRESSDNHRPCYLRPRLPDCNSDVMKFTVVDTSLAQGGMPSQLRELRSLPADATSTYHCNPQGETKSDGSADQSSSDYSSSRSQCESDQHPSDDRKASLTDHLVTDQKSGPTGDEHDHGGQFCELLIDKPPIKEVKYQFSRRPKKYRLASCKLKKGEEHLKIAADDRISQEECNTTVLSHAKYQSRTLIDLNLHPQDMESEGPVGMEVEGSQDDRRPSEFSEQHQQSDDCVARETNDGRRHGTRNRPPTTKALEALACGYLGVGKEKGTRTTHRSGSLASRSSRRARKGAEAALPPPVANPNAMDYGRTTKARFFFDGSHGRTEREEAHELLGVL